MTKKLDELRKKVWGEGSVRNPVAKELLQGDGRFSAKVVKQSNTITASPRKNKLRPSDVQNELTKESKTYGDA